MGVEPTNGGFADLSLGPLGYRAKPLSIAKFVRATGERPRIAHELRAIFLW